ncbi:efflux RND transporter periplasmic adaptor subunit [Terrihabitans rhizophilus]|uniref:Efflux RND transporter periplasmic adaptor subunit n=1 Tax=Terrihabitans rhizophilus TaxID=3092662 RepID=A0ABU4RQ61_9HYPH|nr:efflux RND transporter periplasmic adaptor subunit [Terrihabitans sp. PJ23]MDX6805810.1 efflux RND transporter periplasmic adaptor subunit [Terrihabitans sp. PJ23]
MTLRLQPAPALLAAALLCAGAPARAQDVSFDCVAEPAQRVKVGSAATGILREVLVSRGDLVEAGQPLAKLDSTVEEANAALYRAQAAASENVEAQRTRLELARRRLSRSKQLTTGLVTAEKLDQLEAEFAIAQRDLETELLKRRLAELDRLRAEAALSLRTIASPVSGLVAERNLNPGEFMNQESFVLTLVQLDPLHVEAYVPVALWGRIREGSTGTVTLDPPTGGSYPAKVGVTDQVFDAASGTFGVRLMLPNPENLLPGGQRCRVAFTLEPEAVTAVPGTAPSQP